MRTVVMYSGGVDSTLVAYMCKLKCVDFLAVTFKADYISESEVDYAKRIAKMLGFKHKVLEISPPERFYRNGPDRCYVCKREMLSRLKEEFGDCLIYDGTNGDDLKSNRPGLRANAEFGVISPLSNLKKRDVREIARILGLPNWDRPSNSCLATRVIGEITEEKIRVVERAEDFLKGLGFRFVRVRVGKGEARIEVGEEEVQKVLIYRGDILRFLEGLGFNTVLLDLRGRNV